MIGTFLRYCSPDKAHATNYFDNGKNTSISVNQKRHNRATVFLQIKKKINKKFELRNSITLNNCLLMASDLNKTNK